MSFFSFKFVSSSSSSFYQRIECFFSEHAKLYTKTMHTHREREVDKQCSLFFLLFDYYRTTCR